MESKNKAKPPVFKTREDAISFQIVGAAIEVHRTLGGPGLLESVYEEALVWELDNRDLKVARQKQIPLHYKGRKLKTPLRLDLLVDDCVIVEVKAVEQYNEIFEFQTLTYLRLTQIKLGLIVNFGEKVVKTGIKRVVNGL